MKIRTVGTELSYADRRTDRHNEANSRFSQFCERPHTVGKCNAAKNFHGRNVLRSEIPPPVFGLAKSRLLLHPYADVLDL
jgi:hypothetical protein